MKDKILTTIFYPFVWLHVNIVTIKSVLKHYRFFKEHHPNMTSEMRQQRVIENVLRDLEMFKRDLGIPDRSTE